MTKLNDLIRELNPRSKAALLEVLARWRVFPQNSRRTYPESRKFTSFVVWECAPLQNARELRECLSVMAF
jgi:hypothetical protein